MRTPKRKCLLGFVLVTLMIGFYQTQLDCLAAERRLEGRVRWSGVVPLSEAVLLPATSHLEILPGTVLRIDQPDAVLKVEGTLHVLGTAAEPVRFETVAGWRGIISRQATAVEIHHAYFADAQTALSLQGGKASVTQSDFRNCAVALNATRDADVTISGGQFVGNAVGVKLELKSRARIRETLFRDHPEMALQAVNHSSAHIEKCRFENNHQAVVAARKFPGELRDNQFVGNKSAVVCRRSADGPLLAGNLFSDNETAVISSTFSRPQLIDNRFLDNMTAVASDQFASGVFQYNLFKKNITALRQTRRAAPQIRHNVFDANEVAIFCDLGSYPRVSRNNFSANPLAVKLGPLQSASGALSQERMMEHDRPESGPGKELQGSLPDADQDYVDVRDNWWGEQTRQLAHSSAVQPAIFFDRENYPDVDYEDDAVGAGGPVDRILYEPWRMEPVHEAGPRQ